MQTQHAINSVIQTATMDYFAGERREMWLILAAALITAGLALWLFISERTEFALAFMITVLLFGTLMSAGIVSLMIRDHTLSGTLRRTLQTEQYVSSTSSEKARINVVLSKYKYYRYGAIVLAVIAVAGTMLSGRDWVHGVAAGLFLVVVAQVVIDHFSEQRAHIYFEQLTKS